MARTVSDKLKDLEKLGSFGAFALVFDETSITILAYAFKKKRSAQDIINKFKFPPAKVYRRIITLKKYGLLTFIDKGLNQKGKRFSNYRSNLIRVDTILKPGKFVLELSISNCQKSICLKKNIRTIPILDNKMSLENSETEEGDQAKIKTLEDIAILDLIHLLGASSDFKKLNPLNLKILSVLENAGTKKEIKHASGVSSASVYRNCDDLADKRLLVNIGKILDKDGKRSDVFSSIIREFTLIYINGTFVMNIFVNSRFKTKSIEKILDLKLEKMLAKE